MGRMLVVALAGCAVAAAPAPATAPAPVKRPSGPIVAIPGELMEFEVRLRGVAIGTLQVAVGRPGWVSGRQAVIVKSRGASGGLLALFTRLTWELTSTLDVKRGLPIEATGESTVTFDGKTEHEKVSEHWDDDDNAHDMHSFGATLRGWQLPPGLRTTVSLWLGGGHFMLTVWEAVHEYTSAAHTRAVRFDGIAEDEFHFSVWISDDALRVPVAVEADTKWGKVSAVLVDYEPARD